MKKVVGVLAIILVVLLFWGLCALIGWLAGSSVALMCDPLCDLIERIAQWAKLDRIAKAMH